MQRLVYLLVYPILYLISLLPFRLLYGLSDSIYFLLYYVIGYRKKTVTENLNLVFPEKSEKEIKRIKKTFYRHLCDMFLEMIKSITISDEQLIKRFIIKNPEELKRLENLDKSILVMYGHYASYEWSVVVGHHTNFKGYGIYKRLRNKYFDGLARRIRSKYNITLISSKEAKDAIEAIEKSKERSITAFVSDQSPKTYKSRYWRPFLGVDVPCFTGAESLAKRLNLSVTFLKISKEKRGHYTAEFVPLADNPGDYANYQITDTFTELVENQIKAAPEYYLWTHKRWKHRGKNPESKN